MDRRSAILCLASLTICGCDYPNKSSDYLPTFSKNSKPIFRFGIHPYLNPQDMHRVYQPMIEYLEKNIPDASFTLEASKDYANFEQKLFARELDFALPNPYQTLKSYAYGYYTVAKMAPDSDFRGIIVARKDSKISNIKQLQGHILSFPAPTALAATMMPLLHLHKNGINIKNDIKMRFVGSQYSSIQNVYARNSFAGATWPPPWRAWCAAHPNEAKELEVIAQTDHLVNNSIVIRDDISKELAGKVTSLILGLSGKQEGQIIFTNGNFKGFVPSNNQEYKVVGEFMNNFEKEIGKPELLASLGIGS